jgi:class 3 adenylate cyclase
VSQRLVGAVEALAEAEPGGELPLKRFSKPVPTFKVVGLKAPEAGAAPGR